MYADEINEIANTLLHKSFGGTYALDCLPQHIPKNSSIIVNTHTKGLPGEHWIAVYRRGQLYKVFDPLGFYYPSKLMAYLHERGRVEYNDVHYQPPDSTLCGHYCLLWLSNQ